MNSTTTHTAGPWFVENDEIRVPYPNHHPGIMIARMACFGAGDVHHQKEANARLISAAPDLLTALREVVDQASERYPHFECVRGRQVLERAMVAIAKAKGEA